MAPVTARSRGTAEVLEAHVEGTLAVRRVTAGRLRLGGTERVMRHGKVESRGRVKTPGVEREAAEIAEAGQRCSITVTGVTFIPGAMIETTQ